MRRLLYVPIIHSQPDLGSLGPALAQHTASLAGPQRWRRHQEAVARFWQAVEDYLLPQEATRLRIYQDGLAAGGGMGRRVVELAARRGSPNYQLVLELMNRGAEVRKTEEVPLLLEERQSLAQDELGKQRLLEKRDRSIAENINGSLREGEVAVLFIGAHHQVLPHLAPDIEVEKLKEPGLVRAYFESLLKGEDAGEFQKLALYLASPVSQT